MSNLLYLGLFVVFVAIIIVIRLTGDRRAVVALFVYVIAVHAVLVFAKRDAWPFATHGVFLESGNEYRPLSVPRIVVVDRNGHEKVIGDRTLNVWWLAVGRKMTPQQQDQALAFLLRNAGTRRHFAIAPDWYSTEPNAAGGSGAPQRIRVLLVTRVPAQKLVNGAETSQVLAQFPR